jgi:hypothetical protein
MSSESEIEGDQEERDGQTSAAVAEEGTKEENISTLTFYLSLSLSCPLFLNDKGYYSLSCFYESFME